MNERVCMVCRFPLRIPFAFFTTLLLALGADVHGLS